MLPFKLRPEIIWETDSLLTKKTVLMTLLMISHREG